MPRHPELAVRGRAVSASPFDVLAPLAARLRAEGRLHYPFHIGDSYLLPAEGARRIDLDAEPVHRYCPIPGLPHFRRAVAAALQAQLGVELSEERVFAAPGCTGALSIVANVLTDPGDEVLVITPSWPLIFGILRSQAAVPVEVPIGFDGWPEPDPAGLRRLLLERCSERTVALYLCDPNNPAGFVVPPAHWQVLWEVALERRLWLVLDAVYKDLILDGSPWGAPAIAARPEARQRLVVTGSFSKSHLLAGHRVGFIAAPEELGGAVGGVIAHSTYHASTSAQEMAVAALAAGEGELARVRRSYAEGRKAACGGSAPSPLRALLIER